MAIPSNNNLVRPIDATEAMKLEIFRDLCSRYRIAGPDADQFYRQISCLPELRGGKYLTAAQGKLPPISIGEFEQIHKQLRTQKVRVATSAPLAIVVSLSLIAVVLIMSEGTRKVMFKEKIKPMLDKAEEEARKMVGLPKEDKAPSNTKSNK
jgi:hypothetical protein